MSKIDIHKLRALAMAATPGPWNAPHRPESVVDVWADRDLSDRVAVDWDHPRAIIPEARGRDATYIAAISPDVLIEILDRLVVLEKQLTAAGRDTEEDK